MSTHIEVLDITEAIKQAKKAIEFLEDIPRVITSLNDKIKKLENKVEGLEENVNEYWGGPKVPKK